MEFSILGPVEVTVSGRPLELSGARARAVLATLIVHANHVVAAEQLLDELWPSQPADRALASLQVRMSELRKVLRSVADSPGADRLSTRPPGYLLRVTPAELDSCRLEELRLAALEARAEALLECGKLGDAIVELETLTSAHPLRERLWWLRMLALYRAGRQADALRAYGDLRAILAGELAIEPSPALRDLHAGILRQDPALDRAAPHRLAAGEQDASNGDRGRRGQPFPARRPATR
jgi:DNA-binding SARP family transcriptional activator